MVYGISMEYISTQHMAYVTINIVDDITLAILTYMTYLALYYAMLYDTVIYYTIL